MSAGLLPVCITGATRGLGRALARRLAHQGTPVLGTYRSDHRAAATVASQVDKVVPRGTPPSRWVAGDLATIPGRDAVLAGVRQQPLGGVVLNAGIVIPGPVDRPTSSPDPLLAQLRVDLEAPLYLVRGLLQASCLPDGASIVMVSSNLTRRTVPGMVAYSAAKAGLEGATRALARELGPRGIRVNAVAPGLLQTDMTADRDENVFAAHAREVPLGRLTSVDDVADVVEFLLGQASAMVTGQVIHVDGGWSC
ncbi:MAG: SDR family NAD(P)-dependent oxidoreductase [Nannocystaceae bacterium]